MESGQPLLDGVETIFLGTEALCCGDGLEVQVTKGEKARVGGHFFDSFRSGVEAGHEDGARPTTT